MGERGSNPRAAQVRVEPRKSSAYAGQRNHDLRRGPQPSYVEASRAGENKVVMEPPPPGVLRAINQERRAQRDTKRAMRSDAAVAFVGILTFGTEAQEVFNALKPVKQEEAFEDAARAVADRLNTTLVGLVIHRDETALHAHFTMPAYDLDGNPLTGTVKRQTLKDLQTITAQAFQRYAPAIERGRAVAERVEAGATRAEVVHRSVRQLHADLPVEIAAKEAEVAAADAKAAEARAAEEAAKVAARVAEDDRDALERARATAEEDLAALNAARAAAEAAEAAAAARVAEMEARVRKLEDKAELTVKEAKRLETYRARLTDRIAEEEAARDEVQRLAEDAETRRAAADADAARIAEKSAALLGAAVALTAEVNAGTLRRNEIGKVVARDWGPLKGGIPDLVPAIRAGADAVEARNRATDDAEAARKARERAEADAAAAATARKEAEGLSVVLGGLLRRVSSWFRRPDLSAAAREEAAELLRDAGLPVPEVKSSGGGVRSIVRQAAAQEPPQEAPTPSPVEAPEVIDIPGL